jgi:hypothetical protein
MTGTHRLTGKIKPYRSDKPVVDTDGSDGAYRVGPGRPPKEYQFRPGVSGNPKGASRKTSPIATDLKGLLERELSKKLKLQQGEQERFVSKAAVGIEQLVNQFAKGDRYARRDLIALAETLGVDLTAGQGKTIENALAAAFAAEDEAIIADFLQRQGVQPEHRGDDVDVALNENDSEESVHNATQEKSS